MSAAVEQIDCVVVGAGPAGLSAALWLAGFGVSFVVIERGERIGGELARINLPIENYLGCRAANGRQLLAELETATADRRLPLRFNCAVESIDLQRKRVLTSAGELHARALILATGLRRRRLDVPGAERFADGGGVSQSATTDLDLIAGSPAAVVGGGDGAVENALILAEVCPEVHLIHRRAGFAAQPRLLERMQRNGRIRPWLRASIAQLQEREGRLAQVVIDTPDGRRPLAVPWLVVKIGFVPNVEEIGSAQIELDERGYVLVDRYLRTSVAGVYAAGDLSNPRAPCIAAAVGDGAVAAREASSYLRQEASRAGPEG